jgi:hypothetical protein
MTGRDFPQSFFFLLSIRVLSRRMLTHAHSQATSVRHSSENLLAMTQTLDRARLLRTRSFTSDARRFGGVRRWSSSCSVHRALVSLVNAHGSLYDMSVCLADVLHEHPRRRLLSKWIDHRDNAMLHGYEPRRPLCN